MQSLDVELFEDAVRAMGSLVADITNEVAPRPTVITQQESGGRLAAARIAEMMQPDTPLLKYRWRDRERFFTAAQYAEWLPYLPFQEARGRIFASVGRALRNEVLFLEGERADLEDAEAEIIVGDAMVRFLARRMRDSLRSNAELPPDSLVVRAIERLNLAARGYSEPSDSLRHLLGPAVAEYELLKALRADAEISVDEGLFESIKPYADAR
jgi:hypothetical protein